MPRSRWTHDRLARAAFLAGRGYTPERIAGDRSINSNRASVVACLRGAGMVARECEETDALVAVPADTMVSLGRMKRRRLETLEGMIRRLLGILAADEALLRNVLDDDDEPAQALREIAERRLVAAEE